MNDRINKAFAPLDARINEITSWLEKEKEKMNNYNKYKYKNFKK